MDPAAISLALLVPGTLAAICAYPKEAQRADRWRFLAHQL